MAYSELIKNFEKIRSYMRDFYVYGFRGREEFTSRSSRIYDNEYRRVKGWLEGYIDSYYNESGKKVFISIDSRAIFHNPLYVAFKTKASRTGTFPCTSFCWTFWRTGQPPSGSAWSGSRTGI